MKELQIIDLRRTSIVPVEPIEIKKPERHVRDDLRWYKRALVVQAVTIVVLCVWNYILQAGPI